MAKAIVIAAPGSGSGKTLVTLGLLRAFRNRGLRVASAKVGPDYNGALMKFVQNHWEMRMAEKNSPSLHRAVAAVCNFRPQ